MIPTVSTHSVCFLPRFLCFLLKRCETENQRSSWRKTNPGQTGRAQISWAPSMPPCCQTWSKPIVSPAPLITHAAFHLVTSLCLDSCQVPTGAIFPACLFLILNLLCGPLSATVGLWLQTHLLPLFGIFWPLLQWHYVTFFFFLHFVLCVWILVSWKKKNPKQLFYLECTDLLPDNSHKNYITGKKMLIYI